MITKAIRYTPRAVVQFSLGELRLMLKASAGHYDFVCKQASVERIESEQNRPGFLRGMYNCRKSAGAKWEHVLTFRELDTLAKILEQGHFHVNTPTGALRLQRLRVSISAALSALNNNALDDKKL